MQVYNKILVVGCSYSSGYEFENLKDNPICWTNQLVAKLDAKLLVNSAKTGANNQWIFLETLSQLQKDNYDLVLVQWSGIPRYHFRAGLELYTVDTQLAHNGMDINLVGHQTISSAWLAETGDRLRKLHNDHWDILDLIKYVNTLIEIQKMRNQKIFFINGLAPWSDCYFDKKLISVPNELDAYTRNTILDTDLRDDVEIIALYNMIHDQYTEYGGIQKNHWLNLYNSMDNTKVDTISKTDVHPGSSSQCNFAEAFAQAILQQSVA